MVDVEVVEAVGVRSLSRKQTQGMDGMDGMDADSSRRPLPFARLFSLFGHRAALLLMVAPCVSFLIAAVQTIAWSAGTIRARDLILWNEEHANRATAEQMALLEVPAKFVGNLVFMLLACRDPRREAGRASVPAGVCLLGHDGCRVGRVPQLHVPALS